VFKATSNGGEKVAIKVVDCKYTDSLYHGEWMRESKRETAVLRKMNHENIVTLYDHMWLDSSALKPASLAMKMECMDMDLDKFVTKVKDFQKNDHDFWVNPISIPPIQVGPIEDLALVHR